MTVVPGTSQGGIISIDDVLRNTSADDIILQAGAKYLIDNNVRVFNHSIHAISKFSDQLHLEPSADGLSLKALNSSKSAFASILFTRQFFTECDVAKIDVTANNLCRISIRSALAIFGRSGAHSDRVQLSCKLQVDPRADYLIAQVSYKYFVTKCYVIPFRDCVVSYKHLFNDKTKLRNRLTLPARMLLAILTQIGTDLDEVKIVAQPERFSVERFFTMEEDRTRVRKTEATIDLDVFERYVLQEPSEVAVNLKELKAALNFADATGMPVNLHFDQPGRPIIVAVEENGDFVAEFVLATFEGTNANFEDAVAAEPVVNAAPQEPAPVVMQPLNAVHPEAAPHTAVQRLRLNSPAPPDIPPPPVVLVVATNDGGGDQVAKPIEIGMDDQMVGATIEVGGNAATPLLNPLEDETRQEINPFDAMDNEILTDPPKMTEPAANEDYMLADLDMYTAMLIRSQNGEQISEIAEQSSRLDQDQSTVRPDNRQEPTAQPVASSESSSNQGQEVARVVIDDDAGFNLASWNSKQKRFAERGDLSSDGMAAPAHENPPTFEQISDIVSAEPEPIPPPPADDQRPASPIYDCINLSCSPTVYLDGERPFNIRFAQSQLERLHQINRELPSQQSQQDDGPSTSFVGRLLDAAVEKTKPSTSCHDYADNSGPDANPRTGNFAPAGNAFGQPTSVEEAEEETFPPDFTELNQLENVVEQLQSRFGGFKRRPNTQKFSQERADLVEGLNIFTASPTPTQQGQQRSRRIEPSPVSGLFRSSILGRRKSTQPFTSQNSKPQKETQSHVVNAENGTEVFGTDVVRDHSVARGSSTATHFAGVVNGRDEARNEKPPTVPVMATTCSARPPTVLSRPLEEIERDFHSDNSLADRLIIDEGAEQLSATDGNAEHNASDDIIMVAETVRAPKVMRNSAARPKPTVNNNASTATRFGLQDESNDDWLASQRFRHDAAPSRTTPSTNVHRTRKPANVAGIGDEFRAPAPGKMTQKRSNTVTTRRQDNVTNAAAAATSSTSSVLLEEDNGCDGGWLRKPNTQRSQRHLPPSKNSPAKKPRAKRIHGTDEELENILTSVNNFRDERRRATCRAKAGIGSKPGPANAEGNSRKRVSPLAESSSKPARTSPLRPLRKKPTLAEELSRQPSPPSRIEPPAVIVLTSPNKKRGPT